jgi:predicted metal-dependent phosphoesterase TrpH
VIDLHLHTTASDGLLSPGDLVSAAFDAGLTTIAITDHDTVAGIAAAEMTARVRGMTLVPGIEITAVHEGRDVHVLGYFFDLNHAALGDFLVGQRADRRRRIDEILVRLARVGVPVERPLPGESPGSDIALGRPLIARALVEAGHASSIADAFDRFIGEGQPAFVPRLGASPAEVVALIGAAGGVASLAHPGKSPRPGLVESLIAAGLPAIEVFHPDHRPEDVERYRTLAVTHGLAMTGGSDFHGLNSGRESFLGRMTLPAEHFAALAARVPS